MDVRLAGIRYASENVRLYELEDPAGAPLPAMPPGSHLDLRLPNDASRAYYIAERTRRGTYLLGVRRDPDGIASKYLHDKVRVGARLRIDAIVRAETEVVATEIAPEQGVDARHVVLVAEDVGIFRAWPLLRALDARGRPWELHYDAWSRDDAPLVRELRAYGARVALHVRREHAGAPMPVARLANRLRDAKAWLDATMSRDSAVALADALPGEGRDTASCMTWNGILDERPRGRVAFEVVLAKTNVTIPVHHDQTILDAIARAGIGVPHFCGVGLCGTCRTTVLAGTPVHLDGLLSERERASNRVMMICRSRARDGERLVLDL
jgi:vanillate O-demethylase ferredoxin subunit